MKLVIQIPCYNEAETLPVTMAALPRRLAGVDRVEWVVVNDGSLDGTAEVAAARGADEVVGHPRRLGLARAFATGLATCLKRGADIIVNVDADNQYSADDIPRLIEPILAARADLVIGTRPIASMTHFTAAKRCLQRLGSWVVRKLSGIPVEDAPSGFRALTRRAALRVNVFSGYTYTLETIIQAGQLGIGVECVPVRVNRVLRPSRLVRSVPRYVARSLLTILRIFVTYHPFRTFVALGASLMLLGGAVGLRFVVYWAQGQGGGKVQSLILAAVLLLMGFQLGVLGVLADLISVNRRLLEEIQYLARSRAVGEAGSASPATTSAPRGPS